MDWAFLIIAVSAGAVLFAFWRSDGAAGRVTSRRQKVIDTLALIVLLAMGVSYFTKVRTLVEAAADSAPMAGFLATVVTGASAVVVYRSFSRHFQRRRGQGGEASRQRRTGRRPAAKAARNSR